MQIKRLSANPIVTPALDESIGANINGPSLLRVPEWLPNPWGGRPPGLSTSPTTKAHSSEPQGARGGLPPSTLLLDLALVAFFLLLAGYLRMSRLDLASFSLDEARGLLWASDILENSLFVARGLPTSVGPVNSPAFLYLLTIPLLFSSEPLWATGFIALINTVAVGGCYGITRRWFGLGPAIVASLLFALNPWAVIFSRKVWQPTALPIFTVALLACLLLYQRGRRPWWGAIALFVWAIEIQMHLSAAALLPMVAFALLCGINRGNLRQLSIGVVLFLISFAPMVFSGTRTSWSSLPNLLSTSIGGIDNQSLIMTRELLIGDGYTSLTGESSSQFKRLINEQSSVRSLIARITLYLTMAALFFLLVSPIGNGRSAAIWKRRIGWRNDARLQGGRAVRLNDWSWRRIVIALGVVSPPLMFLFHAWGSVHIHYLLPIWPAACIAVGVLLGDCTNLLASRFSQCRPQPFAYLALTQSASPRRLVLIGSWAVVALWLLPLTAIRITDHAKFLNFVRPIFILTVGAADSIAEAVRSNPSSSDVYLVNLTLDLSEALNYTLRQSHHVRASVNGPWQTLVASQHPTILILWSSDQPITQAITTDLAPYLVGQVSFGDGARTLLIFQVQPEHARELCQWTPTSASTFDGQVALAGTRLQPVEDGNLFGDGRAAAIVVNCWHVRQRPADLPTQLSVFNHLVDRDGNKVTQADGLGHLPVQWQDGDMILNYYLLPMPADLADGEYHLLTGLYRPDTGQRIPIAHDGQVTEQLRSGPFVIEKGSLYPPDVNPQ